MPAEHLAPRLRAAAAAGLGAGAFWGLGLPLPFLLGPMTGCLLAALAGARLSGMGPVGEVMRTVLGVAVGASITPQVLADLPRMAPTLALVPLSLLAAGAIGYPLLRRAGFDHPTAWYGAMPGGLQDMILFGEEAGGRARALSLLHATRVLLVVALAPPLLWAFAGIDLSGAPGQPARETPLPQIAWMALAAAGGWRLAKAVGLFGAAILGPMIAAAALSLAGLLAARPPAEAIALAQTFIGLSLGARYSGIRLAELRHDVSAGALQCLALALLTLAFAQAAVWGGLAPRVEAFLAFAPGGQAEMAVLAILAGADLAFVVSHHILRLTLVILLAPVLAPLAERLWRRLSPGPEP